MYFSKKDTKVSSYYNFESLDLHIKKRFNLKLIASLFNYFGVFSSAILYLS